jgi:predicted dehydrogenase
MREQRTEPLPIAIVGCGLIAEAYVQALLRVPALHLLAVVDPVPAAREGLAADHVVRRFATVEELARAGLPLAAALVLTPPHRHEELCTVLLQRGLHVLCEKPLAPTVEAAESMLKAAQKAGRRLMLGSKFRYTADVVAAHALLDAGSCGEIVLYENVFCSHVDMTRRWNARAAESGGGVLVDNGCHSVDLARFLLGPIARLQAQFGRRVQPVEVEDTARILFTSRSGALGSIDLSWSVYKETPAYVRIHGTRGTIEIGWQQSRWKQTSGPWQVFGHGYDKVTAFAAQLANFAASIRGQETAVIGDEDAMASVVAVACAYRAAAEERWVAIPDSKVP